MEIVLIYDDQGLVAIDSVSPETFISCQLVSENQAILVSRAPISPAYIDGISRVQFTIRPHNEHAIKLFAWPQSEA